MTDERSTGGPSGPPFVIHDDDALYPPKAAARLLALMIFPSNESKRLALLRATEHVAFDHIASGVLPSLQPQERHQGAAYAHRRQMSAMLETIGAAHEFSSVEAKRERNKGIIAGVMLYFLLQTHDNDPDMFSMAKARKWARLWVGTDHSKGQAPPSEKTVRDAWHSHSCVAHFRAAFGPDDDFVIECAANPARFGYYLAVAESIREAAEGMKLADSTGSTTRFVLAPGSACPVRGLSQAKLEEASALASSPLTGDQRAILASQD